MVLGVAGSTLRSEEMQPKPPGSPCTTPPRKTQRYQRISKMRRVRRERNTLEPLWWSVEVKNWTEMLFIVKLLPSTCCKQAVVSIILKETKCLLAWETNLAFLCYWYILMNWSLQWGILNTRFFYYIMCKMWLDRANGFVKAGKLFSHNEFPTLYRSCYATIRMWISLRWSLPSFFNEYYGSLHFSQIHTPCTLFFRIVFEQRWRFHNQFKWITNSPRDLHCKHSWVWPYKHLYMHVTRLLSPVYLSMEVVHTILAPVSETKFCTTQLRVQAPVRADFCCLCSQWGIPYQHVERLVTAVYGQSTVLASSTASDSLNRNCQSSWRAPDSWGVRLCSRSVHILLP